ncbi:hypothetical protein M433DRAFT_158247 [Acidomyces richmondensis BFW]|nr:MAG: hypothetical protein FE78DRAFT_85137 [Acidomyces sp. 'richmondensis']KYG42129.1 hypothetical protein M433DRAFT_158247 [Acidomyces richmondensis BFW]
MFWDDILSRNHSDWYQRFIETAIKQIAILLYSKRAVGHSPPSEPQIRVVCVSDTHGACPSLPPGDLLIHAGDLTQTGSAEELQRVLDWLDSHPHQHKIAIAGNRDFILDQAKTPWDDEARKMLRWGNIKYLHDESRDFKFAGGRTLRVYGSPWTIKHGSWAFQYPQGHDAFSNRMPEDVDVVVTHMPPRFHLDIDGYGDRFLLGELWRVRPSLHVFGHLHRGYGEDFLTYDSFEQSYEQVRSGMVGVIGLLKMVFYVILEYIGLAPVVRSKTHLINASAVGGSRDENLRKPIVVDI